MDSNTTVLVIGARSDIGRAVAQRFATAGCTIQLAARPASLSQGAAEESAPVSYAFDVLDIDKAEAFVQALTPLPDVAVCAVGLLRPQSECDASDHTADLVMRSNYVGPSVVLSALARAFEARGSGTLVGISSVAGVRGRGSNYTYGSAKAGFSAFLSGMRQRLSQRGIHVVTVNPGFVRTQMTADMRLPPVVTAEPEEVAEAVFQAVEHRRNVVFVRRIWRPIMLVIQLIPEFIFKRLST